MRNLKKFLALVLAMMMAFSLVVTGSAAKWDSAAGTFDDSNNVTEAFEEGVAVVTGMKIFKGDAGTKDFRPSANIRRAEVAAIVYRLVTGDVNDTSAGLYTNVAPFTDVNSTDWFAGYVGYLWNAEIIKGSNEERTEFNPYGDVTGYEALAMVLRAMGYDANDEFTGGGWQIRVGQYANKIGLLDNVNTTNYGAGHLNAAARRDTVAEIIFQAAQQPTVVYTPAYNYETTHVWNGQAVANDSLGHANFGLTPTERIVVGNQATGESGTRTGVVRDTSVHYDDGTAGGADIAASMYAYPGTVLTTDNNGDDVVVPAGLNFDFNSSLDLFGHLTKIWYDDRSTTDGKYHSYAQLDKATKVETVATGIIDESPVMSNDGEGVYAAAKTAGFSLPTAQEGGVNSVWASDRYDQMANGGRTINTEVGMYSLVSNSGSKLDVVISIEAEVARIVDTNTTATSTKLVLDDASSQDYNSGGQWTGTKENNLRGSQIDVNSLTERSEKNLDSIVEAWKVLGTNTNNAALPFYDLLKVENQVAGKVVTIRGDAGNEEITLDNGKTIKMSYLYNNVQNLERSLCITQPDPYVAGATYTFYLDHFGRYLGARTSTPVEFIYGTFADYKVGDLGTGSLTYHLTGYNWDADRQDNKLITTYDHDADGVYDPINGSVYEDNLLVAKKNLGTAVGYGNQIDPGAYQGYWIDAEGNLDNYGRIFTGDVTITAADVANGFSDVYKSAPNANDDGKLLLTPSTKFIVVSGTGTDTLSRKVYNGLGEFLDGALSVTIDWDYVDPNGSATPFDVCYQTTRDKYNSVGNYDSNAQVQDNTMVTTVIMSEKAVTRTGTSNLYFAHSENPTTLAMVGGVQQTYNGATHDVRQFRMWNGGTEGYYWIEDLATLAEDTFYDLTKVATVNGMDVYRAVTHAANGTYVADKDNDCLNGSTSNDNYEYIATNNTATAKIGGVVYNVSNATVVDLTGISTGTYTALGNTGFKTVKDINNAVSVGYDVEVSIVNQGANVSLIYVTGLTAPAGV